MKRDKSIRKFFAVLAVDFYKLFRSRSFYVVFGIYAGLTLLNIFLNKAVNVLLDVTYNGEMLTPGADAFTSNPLFGANINYGNLGLFLVIFFAVFLCSEFKDNTIRNKLTQGYSRTTVYFASLTFTYIVSAMAVVLSSLIVAAVGIPVLGWVHTDYALQYALFALFALLPLVALIHTLAYGTRSLGITLGVGLPIIIILPTVMGILNLFVNQSKAIEWTTRIFFISLEEYINLTLQLPQTSVIPKLVLNASLTYVLWTALFIVCGYLSFTKKDIK